MHLPSHAEMRLPPIREMNALLKFVMVATDASAVVIVLGDGTTGVLSAVADGRFETVDTVTQMVKRAVPAMSEQLEFVREE